MTNDKLKLASSKKRKQLARETEKTRDKFGPRLAEHQYPNNILRTRLSPLLSFAFLHVGFIPRQALPMPQPMVIFSSGFLYMGPNLQSLWKESQIWNMLMKMVGGVAYLRGGIPPNLNFGHCKWGMGRSLKIQQLKQKEGKNCCGILLQRTFQVEKKTRAKAQMFTEYTLPWCLGGQRGEKDVILASSRGGKACLKNKQP